MAVDIKNLIAAISPDVFCDDTPDENGVKLRGKVKKVVKEKGYLEGAKEAKLKESNYIDILNTVFAIGAFENAGLKRPIERHKLVYDVFSQNLEPI